MLGLRSWRKPAWPLVLGAAGLVLSGCSGQSFSSADGGGSASGGSGASGSPSGGSASGGTGGSNASAGDAMNGGAPDTSGSGGGGGTTPVCDCDAGHYCREGSTDCFDCSELNRLRFTTPERLATLSDNGQGSNFPRVGSTTTDLVYVFNGTGLRYTADSSTSAGTSVRGTLPQDQGPLLLAESINASPMPGVVGFNFVFDRVNIVRNIYASSWADGVQMPVELPVPFNTGSGDYSMAIALHPGSATTPRAFWMSVRDSGTARLFTAPLQEGATAEVVDLRLAKTDPDKPACTITDNDLSPWVTRDGKTLLFSHTRVDSSCVAVPNQQRDLYTTLLQPATGQPPADASGMVIPATPMNDVNSSSDDVEPSFSADMCDLYFASNRDGNFAVYRAHRR